MVLLYDLGRIPWLDSQVLYHTFPRIDREGLIICQPDSNYVSIGFHQDLLQEVDVNYCRQNDIPVFRREVGGGTVYLDENQVFFQLVLHKDNPLVPLNRTRFYKKFLQPMIDSLNRLGIKGLFRPHCDVIVNNRKISGNGAGEIEAYYVLVGNLLLDFDFETMVRILKVPDEKFRRLLLEQMQLNMTTINGELKAKADPALVKEVLIQSFSRVLGPLSSGVLDSACINKANYLKPMYTSWEWLTEPGKQLPYREVKIREGVYARAGQVILQGVPVNMSLILNNKTIEHLELNGTDNLQETREMLVHLLVGKKVSQAGLKMELKKLITETKLNLQKKELEDLLLLIALRHQ